MIINNLFRKSANYQLEYTLIDASGFKAFADSNITTVEVPSSWSKTSIDILVNQYFRKDGLPTILRKVAEDNIPSWLQRSEADIAKLNNLPQNERYSAESSAKNVFKRIAGAWTYWGYKKSYFTSEEDAKNFFEEIQYIIYKQIASPNAPQLFNTGLHWAYGITGEAQGHYYFSETNNAILPSTNTYERPQTQSCFIQSVEDDLVNKDGIYDLMLKEAKIFKYGSSSGSNFSNIRGKGEKLSGGGHSTGVMSFLKISDFSADVVRSGGNTKSGSKMVVLDADHPEIEDFINWKIKEDEKIVSMVTGSNIVKRILELIFEACKDYQGLEENKYNHLVNEKLKSVIFLASNLMVPEKYIDRALLLAKQNIYDINYAIFTTAWDLEASKTVTGKNTTTFISITNTFMTKYYNNENWYLINRYDGSSYKTIKTSEIFANIAMASWSCNNVGILFHDNTNDWNTCINDGLIKTSTPNFEYLFLDDTACSIAIINLIHFYKKDQNKLIIDTEKLEHVTYLLTIALDISVAMGELPSLKIAQTSFKYRSIGIGYTNAASLLMSMALPYDSKEGRSLIANISAFITGCAYQASAKIAKIKCPFPAYENNKQVFINVIHNHLCALKNEDNYKNIHNKPQALNYNYCIDKGLYNKTLEIWQNILQLAQTIGFRNAQVSCIMPNNNVNIMLDCNTCGIEPDNSLIKYYTDNTGNYNRVVSPYVIEGLSNLGYSEEQIQDIKHHLIGRKTLKSAPFINKKTLSQLGFTSVELEKIENSLASTFNIQFSFNKYIIGDEFCENVLKLDINQLKNPNFSLLEALGFTSEQITEANYYVNGYLTLEDAPHLQKKHINIFTCSVISGKGTKYITPQAHINMVASVQPFITGGISKTLVLPYNSTIEICKEIYEYAWQVGIKVLSITREGSLLHHPLQATLFGNNILDKIDLLSIFLDSSIPKIIKQSQITSDNVIINASKYLAEYTLRKAPIGYRKGYTQKSTINNHKIYLHTSEYQDGKLAEIFIDVENEDSSFSKLMNSFATAISLGLQYGVPLEEFINAFTFSEFYPYGKVKGHNHIHYTTSMIDYIFRDLAINYLERYDLSDKFNRDT